MKDSGKAMNWDEKLFLSDNNGDYISLTDSTFEFVRSDGITAMAAGVDPKYIDRLFPTETAYGWVYAKQKTAINYQSQLLGRNEVEADAISNAPYTRITDPYGARILEIHPGRLSDNLKGTLHNCSLEYEEKNPYIYDDRPYHTKLSDPRDKASWMYTLFALSAEDLNKPIWYTALSYRWGVPDPATDTMIECGGSKIRITRSLDNALRHFRQSDHSINMWIDQICIDQSNNREKEQQIRLMSRIYGHAVNTAIWLGEATEHSVDAFELLAHIGAIFREVGTAPPPEEFERILLPSATDPRWKHLWDLLNQGWFTRLWIIQEVIISDNPWIICGDTKLYWEDFGNCVACILYSGLFTWLQNTHGDNSSDTHTTGWGSVRMLLDERLMYHTQGRERLLNFILPRTRDAQASDLRDKVYGLLGVCRPTDIKISYDDSMTVACVYRAATIACLEAEGTQYSSILCSIDHQSQLKGLPSWVPDWSLGRRTTSLGFSTSSAVLYAASSTLKQSFSIDPDGEALSVQGKVFDIVKETSGICSSPALSHEDPLDSNRHVVTWTDMARKCYPYPGTHNLFDAFWHTLVAGQDGEGWQKSPSSFAEVFSLLLDESTGKSPTLPDQTYSQRQSLPKGRGKLELTSLETRSPGKTYQEILTALRRVMRNRRLSTTEKGYFGLLPRQTEPGDVICILVGCHVPFVLRKAEDATFKVVGECYVHGIMEGEVVEMEDVPWVPVVMT